MLELFRALHKQWTENFKELDKLTTKLNNCEDDLKSLPKEINQLQLNQELITKLLNILDLEFPEGSEEYRNSINSQINHDVIIKKNAEAPLVIFKGAGWASKDIKRQRQQRKNFAG